MDANYENQPNEIIRQKSSITEQISLPQTSKISEQPIIINRKEKPARPPPPATRSILKTKEIEQDLNEIYYAEDTYQSAMASHPNLVKGQKILVSFKRKKKK